MEGLIDRPQEMCKMANPSVKDSNDFYRYLTKFGMYRPSRASTGSRHKIKRARGLEED